MLQPLAADVWEVADQLALPGAVRMPLRMTVLRIGGRLILHSPVPLDDEAGAAISALGTVTWVVAPSPLHHRFIGPCLERWPGARLLGVSGLASKRPELPFQGMLDEGPPPFGDLVQVVAVKGAPAFAEVALHHAPSATLVVTDLLFNITRPASLSTSLVLRLMGTRGRLAMSRAWRFATRDRPALKASVEAILAWPFRRILPGHGDVFEAPDAPGQARQALAWALSSSG